MADVVSTKKRSEMMRGIKGKDTLPEMTIRRAIHAKGFRYKLHNKNLPGKPDMVFPRYKAAVFINGCFWHRHSCHLFKWPQSRKEFWVEKISGNEQRDKKNLELLKKDGWRVLIIWECSIKGKSRLNVDQLSKAIIKWLISTSPFKVIQGTLHDD